LFGDRRLLAGRLVGQVALRERYRRLLAALGDGRAQRASQSSAAQHVLQADLLAAGFHRRRERGHLRGLARIHALVDQVVVRLRPGQATHRDAADFRVARGHGRSKRRR
jgi:hypothetical protein